MGDKRVVLTGATGFLGRPLVRYLAGLGYEVVVLTRDPDKSRALFGDRCVSERWDGKSAAGWGRKADGAFAVINLAGDNLGEGRWTEAKKRRILDSRVQAGRAVAEAVEAAGTKPEVVIQSSGIDYYGPHADEELDETAPSGGGFLADVCRQWEDSTKAVEAWGVRRVVTRSGVVLGSDGGALPRLVMPFRFFAGGPLGNGRQWFSWIHLEDEVLAVRFLLERKDLAGPFNLTAPNPLTEKQFCRTVAEAMKRPCWLPIPAFVLRLAFGEKAEAALLTGKRVVPRRLAQAGFKFRYPDPSLALRDILAKPA